MRMKAAQRALMGAPPFHTLKHPLPGPGHAGAAALRLPARHACAPPRTRRARRRHTTHVSCSSLPVTRLAGSTPSMVASRWMGPSSSSVVTCVISARFFTRPQLSPGRGQRGGGRGQAQGQVGRGVRFGRLQGA